MQEGDEPAAVPLLPQGGVVQGGPDPQVHGGETYSQWQGLCQKSVGYVQVSFFFCALKFLSLSPRIFSEFIFGKSLEVLWQKNLFKIRRTWLNHKILFFPDLGIVEDSTNRSRSHTTDL